MVVNKETETSAEPGGDFGGRLIGFTPICEEKVGAKIWVDSIIESQDVVSDFVVDTPDLTDADLNLVVDANETVAGDIDFVCHNDSGIDNVIDFAVGAMLGNGVTDLFDFIVGERVVEPA